MKKIATPQDLQAEIKAIQAFIHSSEKPDRQVIASKLRELADCLDGGHAVQAASFNGPRWLMQMLRHQRNWSYDKGVVKIQVGDQESVANRLEDKINAEANRNKHSDEDAGFDIEAWGTQDPSTGLYTINVQV